MKSETKPSAQTVRGSERSPLKTLPWLTACPLDQDDGEYGEGHARNEEQHGPKATNDPARRSAAETAVFLASRHLRQRIPRVDDVVRVEAPVERPVPQTVTAVHVRHVHLARQVRCRTASADSRSARQ